MTNDHYISRFLTSRWEVDERKLRFYDFDLDAFDRKPSRTLFAKRGINTPATEDWLNRTIETPVSGYLHRTIGADGQAELIDTSQWELYRAFVGLTILQPQRLEDAEGIGDGTSLNERVASGDPFLDQFAAITSERDAMFGLTLPPTEGLFFPCLGFFVVPVVGDRPVMAVPLSPRHCLCLGPKGDLIEGQVRSWAKNPGTLSTFSIGVASSINKVVIPPISHPSVDNDPVAFKEYLLQMREVAGSLFNLTADGSGVAGLPEWRVTESQKSVDAP